MNSFATITGVETDMMTILRQVERDVGTAGDDGLIAMMEGLSQLAWYVSRVAEETDEWTCFAACEEYRNSLRAVYDNLDARLMAN